MSAADFGAKSRTYQEEIVVSHASRLLHRPVKWIEDRFENLQATTHSRAIDVELELGCDAGGNFTALKAMLTLDVGGYVFTSGVMTSEIAGAHIGNAYRIPNLRPRCNVSAPTKRRSRRIAAPDSRNHAFRRSASST